MSTLIDRLIAMAVVSQKRRRVSVMPVIAIAIAVTLAAGLAYGGLPQTSSGLGKDATSGVHRSTSWRVECISNHDPHWEAREIADRVEAGERVIVGCLQARFARD
jgi:hypothetical protein